VGVRDMVSFMRRVDALQLIYPYSCRHCGVFISHSEVWCPSCMQLLGVADDASLPIMPGLAMVVHAASTYEDPMKTLIHAKFYSDHRASTQLASIMLDRTRIPQLSFDYIVPVPLHWTRYMRRGYNQASVIADGLSHALGVPIFTGLRRIRRTPFQSSLQIRERGGNVDGAFVLDEKKSDQLYDASLLIVDDLMTTGTTLRSVARVLASAHPRLLTGLVGARAS